MSKWSGERSIAGDKDLRLELLCPVKKESVSLPRRQSIIAREDKNGFDLGTS
jgi:hypothetical protein